MKYSSSLLKKYISVTDTPENIAKNFILKTAEIEEVTVRSIAPSIVIGRIEECSKHPEADKLSVCQVNCGDKGQFQILCGGENVAQGLFVPVALPGTYFAKADMTIQLRKMRGLDSNGMICSKEELEINEDTDKHWIRSLTEDLEDISEKDLGTPLAQKFPRLEGYVLEVDNKSLTNRPDLTGHFAAAVELQTMYPNTSITFNKAQQYIEQFRTTHIQEVLDNGTQAKQGLQCSTAGVRTYTLLEINNVTVQTSSFFARLQMLDMGSTPRTNRVDFSNLFMLLSGQPVHFFDAAKIQGDIIVRNATDKEQFTDLFGATHTLLTTDVVIADEKKVLALAGVIGGAESGITESTKNIIVEIANFDPVAVRKTGTRLGLRTDAELRYEKNINPRWTMYCLILFLDELQYYKKDLGDFGIGGTKYYIDPSIQEIKNKQIEINFDRIEQEIFGTATQEYTSTAKDILMKLGFIIHEDKKTIITPPIWRSPDDMNTAQDITEEVARIYGYDNISAIPLNFEVSPTPYTPMIQLTRTLEDILIRNFHADQTETYPRVGEKTLELFGSSKENCYGLQNPVNPETPYLRDSMTYGLVNHIIKNHKFFDTCKIFDLGKVWNKNEPKNNTSKKYASEFVQEAFELGVMLYQKDITSRDNDPILEAKNIVQTIAKQLDITHAIEYKATE
jgi:phenylalanyl-tRNA synthetase beta chain